MYEECLLAICPPPEIKLVLVVGCKFTNDAQDHVYTESGASHCPAGFFFLTLRSPFPTNLMKIAIRTVKGSSV